MDFHCDGKVNYSEFLAATISTINFNKEEKLWSAFKYFDTTDSGYITLDSVMDALKDSGVIIDEEGLKKTFNELKKKEKKINFNEFKAIALGKDIVEEEHEHEFINKEIKDGEQENKLNLRETENEIDNNNIIKKTETVFIREEKKESQDIFFEKVNFSTNNMNNENMDNKENKGNGFNETENNKNDDNNKNQNQPENNNNQGLNINSNAHNSNKNNTKSNNKSSKSNNKSSKSNNKSNKSYLKSSKSNNKSSKSNNKSSKSNVDVLIEEHSIDNNDKFTEVNENN